MVDDAIPAATIVVVREPDDGTAPELLIVERAAGMAFAGGALVFPGGRIDEADRELAAELGLGDDGPERIAAIRETIEETAIPVGFASPPPPDLCLTIQTALSRGEPFASVIEGHRLSLDPAALTPFARWVPKFHAVRRFDTLFFVARAPAGEWQPQALAGECTGAFWLTALEVLERDRRGEAQIIFPTRRNLERLAQHATYGAMVADATSHDVEPISPWVEEIEGERFITIPDNLGYPVIRERLDRLWRG